jgi:isoleucyl-tRNA synthetase
VRDEANKALESKRKDKVIGNSLEAKLVFYAADEERDLLSRYADFLPALFIVSEVEIRSDGEAAGDAFLSALIPGLAVGVAKASGKKCERCWNWSVKVGTFKDQPEVCERCITVVR